MIWITGSITVLIIIYIAVTCRWERQLFSDSIFFVKWMKSSGYYFYKRIFNRICKSSELSEIKNYKKMQQIYVKKNVEREWREYQATKYALIITGILFVSIISSVVLISENNAGQVNDYMLVRPGYGENSKEYSLKAENEDGKEEDIHLTVEAQIYSYEEIQLKFEEYYEKLLTKVKGDNTSFEEIRTDLDFEPDEEWKEIEITWRPSDYDYITEQGNILLEKVPEGKTELSLYLVMTYDQYSRDFEIPITILKYPSDSSESLQTYLEKVQKNSLEDSELKLPDIFDGKHVVYLLKKDNGTAIGIILLIITVIVLLLYRQKSNMNEQFSRRERQMKADYPEIISKLLILVRAGMPIRGAWIRIVEDYYEQKEKGGKMHFAFEEMGNTIKEMNSGTSEGQAYLEFGKRCEQHLYLKMGSLLEQNLKKGSRGIADLLESERIQSLEERKRQVRAEGELAGTRLMMPMMVLFALVLMIIMVPSLMAFGI